MDNSEEYVLQVFRRAQSMLEGDVKPEHVAYLLKLGQKFAQTMVCAATGTFILVSSRATAGPGGHFAIEIYCSDSGTEMPGCWFGSRPPKLIGRSLVCGGSLGRRRFAPKTVWSPLTER